MREEVACKGKRPMLGSRALVRLATWWWLPLLGPLLALGWGLWVAALSLRAQLRFQRHRAGGWVILYRNRTVRLLQGAWGEARVRLQAGERPGARGYIYAAASSQAGSSREHPIAPFALRPRAGQLPVAAHGVGRPAPRHGPRLPRRPRLGEPTQRRHTSV